LRNGITSLEVVEAYAAHWQARQMVAARFGDASDKSRAHPSCQPPTVELCVLHGRSSPHGVNGAGAGVVIMGVSRGPEFALSIEAGEGGVGVIGAAIRAAAGAWSATSQPFAAMQSLKSALA
jgi:hypothetical protein